jgi:hypothetical protein
MRGLSKDEHEGLTAQLDEIDRAVLAVRRDLDRARDGEPTRAYVEVDFARTAADTILDEVGHLAAWLRPIGESCRRAAHAHTGGIRAPRRRARVLPERVPS